MVSLVFRRMRFALCGAAALSILFAGQVAAMTWSTPFAFAPGMDGYQADVAAAGGIVVAVYSVTDGSTSVFARRSIDSGMTWQPAQTLSTNGALPAVAGRGANFDAVWNNDTTGRVRYARSTNGGASFGASVGLSPVGCFCWRPSVARGPGGTVAVAWEDASSHAVQVRVSTNGGVSFGSIRTMTMLGSDLGTAVAIGDNVIYVGYSVGEESLRIRRSTDNGATWGVPATVTNHAWGQGISLTAAGSRAFVAWTGPNTEPNFFKARYRSTADKGANWSAAHDLAPATWSTSEPDLALQGGVLRAVFTRCTPEFDICVNERVFYRQRVIGSSWTAAVRVTPDSFFDATGAHVGFAGKIQVVFIGDASPYAISGTP